MATTSDVTVVTYSGDFRVDSLLSETADWNFLLPGRTTLYYTFNVTAAELTGSGFTGSASAFTAAQETAARALLSYASTVTGITFAEVATSALADIHFADCNLTGPTVAGLCSTSEGWSYNPVGNVLTSYTAEAYVYLDNVEHLAINSIPTSGSAGYEVLLHEIGHALGLGHPFEGTYPLATANDNTNNTVMSYTKAGGFKSTYQSYDLLALRWIYGEDGLGGTWGLNSTSGQSLTLTAGADVTPPTVASFSPADEALSVAVGSDVVVTFNEAIQRGTGNIVLKTSAGVTVATYDAATSANLTISGSTLTLNPTADLAASTAYKVEFAAGSVKDVAGNAYAGTTTYNFTTAAVVVADSTPPTASSFSPADEAISVAVNADITVTFSEAIQRGTGSIVLKTTAGVTVATYDAATSVNLSISGSTLTINPTSDLLNSTAYKVEFASGSIKDLAGNAYAGTTSYNFTTVAAADVTPPTVITFAPLDEATSVAVGTDITLTFSEPIQRGTGSIVLKTSGGVAIATFDAASSNNLSISGSTLTVNPPIDLANSTSYKLEFASGTIKDLAGNGYVGTTAYNFTTIAPTNHLPTGTVLVSGTPTQGQTLTLNTTTLADSDGLGTLSYQWLRSGSTISGASSSSYSLTQSDVGATISALVSYTDGIGVLESVLSSATVAVANVNDAPTGGVTISASASQGGVLSASTSTLKDPDGLGPLQYQWLRDGVAIVGAAQSSYSLTQSDVGTSVSVRVTYVDLGGAKETVTSNATSSIANVNDLPVGAIVLTGKVGQGQTLGVDTTALTDLDGLGAFTYQWLNGTTAIAGATSSTYLVPDSALGAIINVRIAYTDGFGALETVTSTSKAIVADGSPPTVTSFSPADESTGVAVGTKIDVNFNETIQRGTGNIVLKTSAGVTIATYDAATSGNIVLTGNSLTIFPAALLANGTEYRLEFASGTVKDLAGNAFAGTTSYNFTTFSLNQTVSGTSGNDILSGGPGNDVLNGGGGIDIAAFTGAITGYRINFNRALGTATITDTQNGRDGTDTLTGIEKLQFAGKMFELVNPPRTESPSYGKTASFLFDASYYLLKHPDLVPAVTLATAFDSFKSTVAQGAAPNAWFDPVYYANRWADLKSLNLDAATLFAHYNLYGVWEGRSAGSIFDKFDGNAYLTANPDVAAYVDAYVKDFLGSRTNGAIAHYVIYGANEGRLAHDTSGALIPADFTIEATLIGTGG